MLFYENKLSINTRKTRVTKGGLRHNTSCYFILHINDVVLDQVGLGCIFDQYLQWDVQINSI